MKNSAGQRLVVIGNGMAGTACLEEIVKLGPERFEITVFGAERHLNYNRVLLTNVLSGEKDLSSIVLHDRSWYAERGIRLHTGSEVLSINRARRTISTQGFEQGYERLILCTGALPVMPDIPGMDKVGVVTFRDIDDCARIKALAGRGRRAAVLGGGLLGLEAARGLLGLGLDVTVIHLMDRLMERQLDGPSSGLLNEDIERLGIKVLLGRRAVEVKGSGRVEAIALGSGEEVPAEMVVVSIGIKPNIGLARSCGIYCERGIVVSDTMQTYDPAVYAAGECVQHRGKTFGLVAPIFEQARVLADHLAGSSRLVFKNRPTSTRLKVPGIDLYSAGDVSEECRDTIEYGDSGSRIYKKIFLDGGRIKGVVMYGDTKEGPSLFTSILDGGDVSAERQALLLPAVHGRQTPAPDGLADDSIICGCNGVTKKMIVDAIVQKGLFTREDVKRETKASSSCGGCAPMVDGILEATLGSSFQAAAGANVCGCTKYTRDDVIKNIREKGLRSVSEVMQTLGWESVGCDRCRPALNYYVSMVWPGAEDDQTSRLVNERVHANIQRDGTYSVVPRVYGGVTTPEDLRKIAAVAERYNAALIKLTGGQRIDIIGIKKEDLAGVWEELGMESGYAYGKALRTVKTCVGERFCRYGTQDSLDIGIELEKKFKGLWMPAKVKLSVSGCPRNCAESGIKDVGVVGVAGGLEVYAGGCGGIEFKGGVRLCTVKNRAELVETVSAFLQLYRQEAIYGERVFKWLGRAGISAVKKALDDPEKRQALCKGLDKALSVLKDPWRSRIRAAS